MIHSTNRDQVLQYLASDLGLRCLLTPVGPNTKGKYGIFLVSLDVASNC